MSYNKKEIRVVIWDDASKSLKHLTKATGMNATAIINLLLLADNAEEILHGKPEGR